MHVRRLSQGEVFVPLQLLVSAALARFFGFAAQPVCSHLHEGAEAGVTARQLGRLGLGGNHWVMRVTLHLTLSFFSRRSPESQNEKTIDFLN